MIVHGIIQAAFTVPFHRAAAGATMPVVLIARVDSTPYMLFGIDTFTSMCGSMTQGEGSDQHISQRSESTPSIADAKQKSVLVSECMCLFVLSLEILHFSLPIIIANEQKVPKTLVVSEGFQ